MANSVVVLYESTYLGEFDGRCESCEDKSSNIDVEIDPYGSHVCNGYPMVSELQDMTLLQSWCSTPYRDVSVSCISVLGTVFGSYKTWCLHTYV